MVNYKRIFLELKILSSSASVNKKHPQRSTPIAQTKDNSKVSPWKLWQTKNENHEFENDNSNTYRNSDKDEKWDVIESSQIVDFTKPPNIGDSFFSKYNYKHWIISKRNLMLIFSRLFSDKSTAIVSTPNSNFANTEYPNTTASDNTLIA